MIISTHTNWVQTDIHVTPAGRSFKWLNTYKAIQVSVAPASGGGICIYVHVGPGTGDDGPGCSFRRPRANGLEVLPVLVGFGVLGGAGANIARAEVRFSDGRSATAPLRDGVIFYVVQRRNYAAGHRPVELVGRDSSGHVVARKRLPFGR